MLVEKNSNARLEMKLKYFSPIYGFEAENIALNTEEGVPIFKANRIHLSWFFPGFLAGHVGIRELRIEHPRLFLIKTSKDDWNIYSLYKPSPDDEDTMQLPDSIELFFPVKLYGDLRVNDFELHIRNPYDQRKQELHMSQVSLAVAFITRTFHTVPLNLELLDLFDTLVIAFNPHTSPGLRYKNGDRTVDGKALAKFILYKESGETRTEFLSRLQIDGEKLYAIRSGHRDLPLGYSLYFDTSYDAPNDLFYVKQFRLNHERHNVLSLQASIKNVTSPRRKLDLKIRNAHLNLHHIGEWLDSFLAPERQTNLEGVLDIRSMELEGTLDRLRIESDLYATGLRLKTGEIRHSIDNLFMNLTGEIDLTDILPLGDGAASDGQKKNLAFHVFHRLILNNVSARYNDGIIAAKGSILPETGIMLEARISNVLLDTFSAPYFLGRGFASLKVQSTENFDTLKFDGVVGVRNAQYSLQRSRSSRFLLHLNSAGVITIAPGNIRIHTDQVHLSGDNEFGESMIRLKGNADVQFQQAHSSYQFHIAGLNVAYKKMHPTLPDTLQRTMDSFYTYLSEGVLLSGDFNYSRSGENQNIESGLTLQLPYLNVDDLRIDASTYLSPGLIDIRRFSAIAFRNSLKVTLTGNMSRPSIESPWRPDMQFRLLWSHDRMLPVHKQITMKGKMEANFNLGEDSVDGSLKMAGVDVDYTSGQCASPSSLECRIWHLTNINLSLPVHHDIGPDIQTKEFSPPVSVVGDSMLFYKDKNFTVSSISSNKTPAGEYIDGNYFIFGNDRLNENGFESSIQYKNNTVWISQIRLQVFQKNEKQWQPEGMIDGHDIYLHLGNFDPEKMSFSGRFQAQNLDLAPFLTTGKGYNGIINANLQAEGRNLKDPIPNTTLYLDMYRVSEDFSGFATRVLIPAKSVAFTANQTLAIPAIKIELKGGLVYSSISVNQSGAFSRFIRTSGEEIKQERIPLAQFLERAKHEAGTLAVDRKGTSSRGGSQ